MRTLAILWALLVPINAFLAVAYVAEGRIALAVAWGAVGIANALLAAFAWRESRSWRM